MNFTSSVPLRYLYLRGTDRDEFTNDFKPRHREWEGYDDREKTGRAQDHGHDAQTAGRKIQRMIAAMTADVGIVRIQDTRIFPSMDHWTCLQPSDASATAVTAPIWQCVVETGCSWIVA